MSFNVFICPFLDYTLAPTITGTVVVLRGYIFLISVSLSFYLLISLYSLTDVLLAVGTDISIKTYVSLVSSLIIIAFIFLTVSIAKSQKSEAHLLLLLVLVDVYSIFHYSIFHHHHHHDVRLARISLTLSLHVSLSFIAFGRSSALHPVSSHSCCMNVRAGRPAFDWPYAGVHRSTSLTISSLLL